MRRELEKARKCVRTGRTESSRQAIRVFEYCENGGSADDKSSFIKMVIRLNSKKGVSL